MKLVNPPRTGARTMAAVPEDVRALLARGETESVNLMEWLATDMSALAHAVAADCDDQTAAALLAAATAMSGLGVTGRLLAAGRAIAEGVGAEGERFEWLAKHPSDIVRQWACYAVNDPGANGTVGDRLKATLRFADDQNMSVRETAWMAFRPHLAANVDGVLPLLMPLTSDLSANIRRFAIEVTRPRSVWGAHIAALKRHPERAAMLLEAVSADESRYVQLAVGNWLNDASKSRPDWVETVCKRWACNGSRHTEFITRRGSRSMSRKSVRTRAPGGLLIGAPGETV